jgi:hypothetical protein
MNLRWLKFIAIMTITPLLMATSCTKSGPYYSLEHEIECPPEEYNLPMYKELGQFTLQMTDKLKGRCKGLPSFTMKTNNSKYIMLYAKVLRNQKSCKLAVAFPTYDQGMSYTVNRRDMKKREAFKEHEKSARIFPKMVGLKTSGEVQVVEGKTNEEDIRKWCESI